MCAFFVRFFFFIQTYHLFISCCGESCFVHGLPAGVAGRLPSSAVHRVWGISGNAAVQASVAGALASSPCST